MKDYSSDLGSFSWEELPWDSKILERRTAKVVSLDPKDEPKNLVEELIFSLEKEKIEYATFRVNASKFKMIHALEENGFRLVDGYLELECEIEGTEDLSEIRIAEKKDLPRLQEIAANSFSKTRFYNDPLIKKSQADKIYSEWIKNSILGKMADVVLVWEEKGNILGFVTLRKNGNLTLIAVAKEAQGKGIGKSLVKAALSQFKKWGLSKSSIETQITNISALRIYEACGYKIKDSYLTFRWSYAD